MAKTVADALIERLLDWGEGTIFGLPGDGVNGLFEAIRTRQDRLRFTADAARYAVNGGL